MSVTMEDSSSHPWRHLGKGSDPTKKELAESYKLLKSLEKYYGKLISVE